METPDLGKTTLWTHIAERWHRIDFGIWIPIPHRKVIGVMDDIGSLIERTGLIGDIEFNFCVSVPWHCNWRYITLSDDCCGFGIWICSIQDRIHWDPCTRFINESDYGRVWKSVDIWILKAVLLHVVCIWHVCDLNVSFCHHLVCWTLTLEDAF